VICIHPIQRDCDTGNPKQHASWCWAAGIPDPSPSRPIPIPLIGPVLVESVSQLLWDFGFRHHPDLQTKWIEGMAGLGTVAKLSDTQPADDFDELAHQFLAENNPDVLDALKSGNPAEREKLLARLENNFEQLRGLIDTLKED
jgi:hypothetical protein